MNYRLTPALFESFAGVDYKTRALVQVKHCDKFSLLVKASECWTAVRPS